MGAAGKSADVLAALRRLFAAIWSFLQVFLAPLFGQSVRFQSGRRVTIVNQLAEGGFSFVFVARESGSGKRVALKKMICQDDEAKESARHEAEMHRKFQHDNLLPLVDSSFEPHPGVPSWENCWFVFPLCDCSLRDEITRRVLGEELIPWGAEEFLKMIRGVCSGLLEMHRQGIAHKDLKPENVVLRKDASGAVGTPILMDFGSCSAAEIPLKSRRDAAREVDLAAQLCTMQYRAPELFDAPSEGVLSYAKADVWSLGATVYCCLFGYSPFEVEFEEKPPCKPRQVDSGHLRVISGVPWPRGGPIVVPVPMREVIPWVLTVDPGKRPGVQEVLDRLGRAPATFDIV
mmetsp:Transcript_107402/g.245867  ORF Transcript_107402/g.245867 Transcript_107402/m.245867 type:complete len:346 (+) Transcript_107402:17-1054(+)